MRIQGQGTNTYLLINGIALQRRIELYDGVSIYPAKCDVSVANYIDPTKRGLDHAVATIFLPIVNSQIRIEDPDPQTLAIKAWNAVWDAMLLSALFNCEATCNLQADSSVETLTKSSEILVTNYHLRGFSMNAPRIISEKEAIWIEKYFPIALSLMGEPVFRNAIHALSSYRWHIHHIPRLAVIWSGMEGLWAADSEITFKISIFISRYLEPRNKLKRQNLFNECKKLYGQRSKAVHGSKSKGDARAVVEQSADLLLRVVRRAIEKGALPQGSDLVP